MVILHDEEYYKSRVPQPDLGPIGNFSRFIWNKERKTIFDRTAKEWGIVFKPNSVSSASPIISINNASANAKPKRYIEALTDFLQEYHKNTSYYNLNCQDKSGGSNYFEKPCFFDITNLGTCSKPPFGYTEPMQPCILIKFNKRFDWVPVCYNRSSHLPESMPSNLKKMVLESDKLHVWLSCDGVNNVDKEHMGEIEYTPRPGFSNEYFPFAGQPHYLSPIVALQFKNLTPNRLVTIECNLWAANIQDRARKALDFQIIIAS
ncbi:sodium/potassium-transporting ATPase subunit beta-1-like isoform X2 [Megachile rotundata]|uniref:sodium/potassium-transporting ATPase subunit beta-1-like isoform X2 n=1 Tax=Megachile rotundata TaxID=143995 RepID=UPI000614EA4E|nr:PREDICTED: sodium/potassium-transporting ATPase subunit beta-1-like isoform X2 [Megachile rotundata]